MMLRKNKSEAAEINEVTVRGTCVRKTYANDVLIFVVATNNPVTRMSDYPRIIAFGDLAEQMDGLFEKGDRIAVKGVVQTSKRYPQGTVVAKAVEKELTRIDAALNEQEYKQDMNRMLLRGVLAGPPYCPNEKVTILPVKVMDGDYASYPRVVCFGRLAATAAEKRDGDCVDILGYIQTSKRDLPQSYVAQNLR